MKKLLLLSALSIFSLCQSQDLGTNEVSFPDANSTAKIELNNTTSTATITITGPNDRWFALVYGSFGNGMTAGNDVLFYGNGPTVGDGRTQGFTLIANDMVNNYTIVSNDNNTPSAGQRTIVVTRSFNTGDANDFAFTGSEANIDLAMVQGSSANFTLAPHGGGANADRALDSPFQALGTIESETAKESTQISPNPATNELNIQSSFNIQSVSIYNSNGQFISASKENLNKKSLQFGITKLSAGVYFAQVHFSNGESHYYKFVKK